MCNPEKCPLNSIFERELDEAKQNFVACIDESSSELDEIDAWLDGEPEPEFSELLLSSAGIFRKEAAHSRAYARYSHLLFQKASELITCKGAAIKRQHGIFGKIIAQECGSPERRGRVEEATVNIE